MKFRIGGRAAGYRTEPGSEDRELQQDLGEWHEDVGSDECPWVDTEQEPKQD